MPPLPPDPLWHRRAVLAAMAGLAAAPIVPLDAGARATNDPFQLGVASGDPGLDGFVLWTRLVGRDALPLPSPWGPDPRPVR
jgi:alkaline phosphatase D